jgi:hypothetical protein
MSQRERELLLFYRKHRIGDQLLFYRTRSELFDRATGQALALSAMLLGFASAAGALAGTNVGWTQGWSALATILPAMSTALAAYSALYTFDHQSKIYSDAVRALNAASRPMPDLDIPEDERPPEANIAELVKRVESVLRQEQAQWGQLTSQLRIVDGTEQ